MMIPADMVQNRGLEFDRVYTITEGPSTGAQYKIERGVNTGHSSGFDGSQYAIVQVFTKIGWTPIKTPARIDHVITLMAACSEI